MHNREVRQPKLHLQIKRRSKKEIWNNLKRKRQKNELKKKWEIVKETWEREREKERFVVYFGQRLGCVFGSILLGQTN